MEIGRSSTNVLIQILQYVTDAENWEQINSQKHNVPTDSYLQLSDFMFHFSVLIKK